MSDHRGVGSITYQWVRGAVTVLYPHSRGLVLNMVGAWCGSLTRLDS